MDRETYRRRRDRLLDRCPKGIVLVGGVRLGGLNPNFFYLTGLEESRGALLLAAEGIRIETGARFPGRDYVRGRLVQQLLLLPASDPVAHRWGEDGAATVEHLPAAEAGVDAVLPIGELEAVLGRALLSASTLHYVRGSDPTLLGQDDPDSLFVSRIRRRFFGLDVRDVTNLVHEARMRKDAAEIAAVQRAIDLTGKALASVLGQIEAGLHEYQLEAELTRQYRSAGATHAFDPIVATGANAAMPHYRQNNARLAPGQLVLIDTGASLGGYKGDLTRTYPVDGRFTKRQRTIYETVLGAQAEVIGRCRPGTCLGDLHAAAFDYIDAAGFGKYFIHGTSHRLGLETHDAGDVHRALEAGSVITVEPGIYVPEEATGVRIEDDVLVTSGAPEVLSRSVPSSVAAIEEAMA